MSNGLYNGLVVELERRRRAIGLPMDSVSELAGTADRSYAKILNPETPSGRRASWEMMQTMLDVLFCGGFTIKVVPSTTGPVTSGTRKKIIEEAVTYDSQTLSDRMSELAMRGGHARAANLTPEQRKASASRAAKTRWAKVRAARREERRAANRPADTPQGTPL